MQRNVYQLLLCLCAVLLSCASAHAQQSAKGNWTFTTTTSIGQFNAHCTFQSNGRGFIFAGNDRFVPITYRERSSNFSAAFEAREFLPEGIDISIVYRGTKLDNNTIDGNIIIITDTPDLSSPTGFYTYQLHFLGKRDQ